MPDLDSEMKLTADIAINSARERFNQELDYSEKSIAKLEHILQQIYWGFSHSTRDKGEHGLILTTANLWGSYLGEYLRLKWGGTWVGKGSDKLVLINGREFSPIGLVHQKLTNHPEFSVENFIDKVKWELYPPVIKPQESQSKVEEIIPLNEQVSKKESIIPFVIDKRLLITLASVAGFLFLILLSISGYKMIRAGGVPTFELTASTTPSSTNSPYYTATLLPSYTPKPTNTRRPTHTPSQTRTQIASLTPTATQPSSTPTRVRTVIVPTNTRVPETEVPAATATFIPVPPPVVIESCSVDPSTVPAGTNTTIAFIVHFSTNAPGYGFDTSFDSSYTGQTSCSGTDGDGDGIAFCDGSSGELPGSTTVNVTFKSSVGDCIASYGSP
jgi:hypothetical protein